MWPLRGMEDSDRETQQRFAPRQISMSKRILCIDLTWPRALSFCRLTVTRCAPDVKTESAHLGVTEATMSMPP